MDWYYNFQFSDPDDDDTGVPEEWGDWFEEDSASNGSVPSVKQSNTGLQSDGGDGLANEPGSDNVPDGYSVCSVCHQFSFFNDVCEWCGFGEDEASQPPAAAKA